MKIFKSEIPHLEVFIDKYLIILKSKKKLECLSNAAINGGRMKAKTIINHQVPSDFQYTVLENVLSPVKKEYNLTEPIIGLLTAVKMNEAIIVNDKIQDIDYLTVITAGLSNTIAPYYDDSQDIKDIDFIEHFPGTINTIIIFDCKLTEFALVNLFITLTEVKTLLLNKYNIRMSNGRLASGTSTDTIAIGFTANEPLIKWSGFATEFGQSVGKTVFNALKMALMKGGWI